MEKNTSKINDYNTNNNNNFITLFYYYNLLNTICYYMQFVVIPGGLVANLVSIFIFTRPNLNQKTNTGFLYMILCILNIVKILFRTVFKQWERFVEFRFNLHFNSEYFIDNVILQTLSWSQALISFDRFISVFSPIKGVRIMAKKWVLYLIMLGLFIFILFANSPYFIRGTTITTYEYYNYSYSYFQNYQMSNEIYVIYEYINMIMEVYMPYFIMVILDISVIVRLKRSKLQTNRQQTRIRRSTRFTINTILIDLIYLIFNFPASFFSLFFLVNHNRDLTSISNIYFIVFISHLLTVLKLIYSCFLFFLFVCFNRNFRSEFFSIGLMLKINKCFKRNDNLAV